VSENIESTGTAEGVITVDGRELYFHQVGDQTTVFTMYEVTAEQLETIRQMIDRMRELNREAMKRTH